MLNFSRVEKILHFDFHIVSFPFFSGKIYPGPTRGVYITAQFSISQKGFT